MNGVYTEKRSALPTEGGFGLPPMSIRANSEGTHSAEYVAAVDTDESSTV
jgi:hypothetical protein